MLASLLASGGAAGAIVAVGFVISVIFAGVKVHRRHTLLQEVVRKSLSDNARDREWAAFLIDRLLDNNTNSRTDRIIDRWLRLRGRMPDLRVSEARPHKSELPDVPVVPPTEPVDPPKDPPLVGPGGDHAGQP